MTLNTCHERLIVERYLVERLKTFRVVLKGEGEHSLCMQGGALLHITTHGCFTHIALCWKKIII